MTLLCSVRVVSPAAPERFFARWEDAAGRPEWDTALEWVRLDGPFAVGTTGVLKPRRGPRARFVVVSLVPGREFTEVSSLPGAKLSVGHTVEPQSDGRTAVTVTVSVSGPLAPVWAWLLRRGVARSTSEGLRRLVEVAGSADPPAPDAPPAPAPS